MIYTIEESPDTERQVMITKELSNPEYGTINFRTPIAQALLGAFVGDKVLAKLPNGRVNIIIKQIKKGWQ